MRIAFILLQIFILLVGSNAQSEKLRSHKILNNGKLSGPKQPYNPSKFTNSKPVKPGKTSNLKPIYQNSKISGVVDTLKVDLKKMKGKFLKSQLKDRPADAARENKNGFHFMKKDSPLDGYFTMDVKYPTNTDGRGKMRLLFKTNTNNIKASEPIGLIDSHGGNVKLWKDVKPSEKASFTKIKNANGQEVGVRMINTITDRNSDTMSQLPLKKSG